MSEQIVRKFLTDSSASCVLLSGDASNRNYYRVIEGGGPKIICYDSPARSNFSLDRNLEMYHLLKKNGVRIPTFGKVDLNLGIAELEDVGDQTLLKKLAIVSEEQEFKLYKSAIDEMIKIHRVPGDGQRCFRESFDYEKLMFEVSHTVKYFVYGLLAKEKSSDIGDQIEREFGVICRELACGEKVLVHRDFHCRNIMVHQEDLYVIDYQDARMGLPQYDLVSLLDDCYYRLSDANYGRLKKYYCEQQEIKDVIRFDNLYVKMAIQRLFKAIGTFSYMKVVKEDDRYLLNIGYAFEKLRSFLSQNSQFSLLKDLLSKIYYENQ